MIGRLLWFAALAIFGVVTAGVQWDRQARKVPTMASSVPELFRSTAQLPVAAYALDGEDPSYALAQAQTLVRRRPLPAEHLRLLAQAQFAAGDVEQSALTIQYAAQRGWRDPLAQESMLRLALNAGDSAESARRYAALFLRRDTEDALLEELGPPVLAEAGGEGRQTLIEIVSGGDRWHKHFLRRGSRVMPIDAFAEIVSATAEAGTRYDCRILRQIEPGLNNRDSSSSAVIAAVIEKQC